MGFVSLNYFVYSHNVLLSFHSILIPRCLSFFRQCPCLSTYPHPTLMVSR